MSFQTIINKYRIESTSTADQGTKFERLMKYYLLTSPTFRGQGIEEVWLWSEFPYRDQFGTGHDVGIDLVVKTEFGDYWAVQCKCYAKDKKIEKRMLTHSLLLLDVSFMMKMVIRLIFQEGSG